MPVGHYARRHGLILQMRTKKKRKDTPEISDEEFLTSAKTYLSTDFPNPQRTGCPPESELKTLAERPRQAEQPARQHITCCSPCFNRYMELLAELKCSKAG
jgi:hypothetical protein